MPRLNKEFQAFLDENQYTEGNICRYEKVFGRGFVSPGGLHSTKVTMMHPNKLGGFANIFNYHIK